MDDVTKTFDYSEDGHAIWVDRLGNKTPVNKMSETHLQNALKMLEGFRPSFPNMRTEIAQDVAEIEYETATAKRDAWIDIIKNEIQYRGAV